MTRPLILFYYLRLTFSLLAKIKRITTDSASHCNSKIEARLDRRTIDCSLSTRSKIESAKAKAVFYSFRFFKISIENLAVRRICFDSRNDFREL